MRCRRVRQRLSAFLDGELPNALRDRLAAHLDSCVECRATLDRFRRLAPVLESSPAPGVPDWLPERVLARAQERLERRRRGLFDPLAAFAQWLALGMRGMRPAVTAAALVGVVLGSLMGWTLSRKPVAGSTIAASSRETLESLYGLDALGGAPADSLEIAYAELTSAPQAPPAFFAETKGVR